MQFIYSKIVGIPMYNVWSVWYNILSYNTMRYGVRRDETL